MSGTSSSGLDFETVFCELDSQLKRSLKRRPFSQSGSRTLICCRKVTNRLDFATESYERYLYSFGCKRVGYQLVLILNQTRIQFTDWCATHRARCVKNENTRAAWLWIHRKRNFVFETNLL